MQTNACADDTKLHRYVFHTMLKRLKEGDRERGEERVCMQVGSFIATVGERGRRQSEQR